MLRDLRQRGLPLGRIVRTLDEYAKVHREVLTRLPGADQIRSIFTYAKSRAADSGTASHGIEPLESRRDRQR